MIALPETKRLKWKAIIKDILQSDEYQVKEIECLIEKLAWVLLIVLGSSSFLKPIHNSLYTAVRNIAKINKVCKKDL